jgi:hypothetical protein
VLIWGIVAVFGLAVGVAAISVHGSADERAAIRRAVRAPLLDLRRRDARRLCDDFTAGVRAHLAPGAGSCDSRLAEDFRMASATFLSPSTDGSALASHLRVNAISWDGNRATAVSFYAGDRSSVHRWRLQRVGDAWRIATPATLRLQADCPRPQPAERGCAGALSMHFAGGREAG